jgi:NADH:ubiquinone oxidoreductase subunit 3 (subunit A)
MAVAAHAYAEPVVKEVQPRPLVDQVVPVAILMVVFTMCMAVLLPILVPMMALGAVSLALVAVSLVVVVTCALGFMVFVLRVKRDTGGQVVRGQVLKRR